MIELSLFPSQGIVLALYSKLEYQKWSGQAGPLMTNAVIQKSLSL